MSNRLRVAACALLLTASSFAGTIIHVPANQPTIQAGINAATNGDTVLVAPGTYNENNINFQGKAITVKSSNGPSVTTVVNSGVGATFVFNKGEGAASVLEGFTITGGIGTVGITVGYSPTILNNRITGNHACDGAGILVDDGSPTIKGNTISNNFHDQCSGGVGGAGIAVIGPSNAQIIGNVISGNDGGNGASGGGIAMDAAISPVIMNNVIMNNTIQFAGGGIGMINDVHAAIIVQNLIIGNKSPQGSGVYWSGPPAVFVNNTVSDSATSSDSTISVDDFATGLTFANNMVVALHGATNALRCSYTDIQNPSTFYNNDVYSANGTSYGDLCTSQTGMRGNISANAMFVGTNNFRLKGGSPAIDAGSNSAPNLPSKDLVGNPRIINGNGLATAIVDMGAYEFVPVVLAPKSLGFGLQAVGSSTNKTVTLTNAQNKLLNVSSYTVPTGYSVSGCGSSIAAFSSCTLTITFHPLTSGTFKGSLVVKDDAGNSPQSVALSGSAH